MIDRFEKFLIDAKLKQENFYTYDKASNYKNAKTNLIRISYKDFKKIDSILHIALI